MPQPQAGINRGAAPGCVATSRERHAPGWLRLGVLSLLLGMLCGCSTPRQLGHRQFIFGKDTFAYANELVWEYGYDENGKWSSHPRDPEPTYSHHCFVVARSARQFFFGARFDPEQPPLDETAYRRLVQRVIRSNPRRIPAEQEKIVIPGYANLYDFSQEYESLLKAECGSWWQSYFQRGHWRMIFPFSRNHQERAAQEIQTSLREYRPVVLHLVRFPQLTINHAVVAFASCASESEVAFSIYDPNRPGEPVILRYDSRERTFFLPANDYFPGGRVDVYEVFKNWRF